MLSEPQITQMAQMGCDAPRRFVPMVVCIGDCACCLNRGLHRLRRWAVMHRHFCPDGCLYRGLRVLSEPRITLIFADGL